MPQTRILRGDGHTYPLARHEAPPLLGVRETVPVLRGLMKTGTLLGSYEILGRLGAGSMGEVYRARDVNLQRDVAIKILLDEIANDEDRLRRFEQEALTASSLSHPNIVHIYALGEESGKFFVVMELVDRVMRSSRRVSTPKI